MSVLVVRLFFTSSNGIKQCPTSWYDSHNSGTTKNSSSHLLIGGSWMDARDVDIGWVKKHCEIKEPQLVY